MTAAKMKKKIREKAGKHQFAYDKQMLEEKKRMRTLFWWPVL